MIKRFYVECPRCGGSGFDSPGSGYDSVCSECGGTKFLPWEQPMLQDDRARMLADRLRWICEQRIIGLDLANEVVNSNLRQIVFYLDMLIGLATRWECKARKQGSVGGDPPPDCNWPVCGCDERASEVIEALQEAVSPQFDCEQWQPPETIPQIGAGQEREYVIAVYRKRSDKVYSFAASYLNAVPLSYDDCPFGEEAHKCKHCTDDGCPTTGWHCLTGENGEGGSCDGIDLRDGDKLVGWRELPRWKATLTEE